MSKKIFKILLASRPSGEPTLENFDTRENSIQHLSPAACCCVRFTFLSSSYMRGRMNAGKSYAKPVEIGTVMEGRTIAEVVSSDLDGFKAGDIVLNPDMVGKVFASSDGKGVHKIAPSTTPASYALGVSGRLVSRPIPA